MQINVIATTGAWIRILSSSVQLNKLFTSIRVTHLHQIIGTTYPFRASRRLTSTRRCFFFHSFVVTGIRVMPLSPPHLQSNMSASMFLNFCLQNIVCRLQHQPVQHFPSQRLNFESPLSMN